MRAVRENEHKQRDTGHGSNGNLKQEENVGNTQKIRQLLWREGN